MDIDAYSARHRPAWKRLEFLGRKRRLDGAEIDELVGLYQRSSSDLATLTSSATDPDLVLELTRIVQSARGRISGARAGAFKTFGYFFTVTLPLAMYRLGPLFLATLAYSLFIAVFTGFWVYNHPEIMTAQGSELDLQRYAQEAFIAYYSNHPAPDFMAQLWTHNASIAVYMVATFMTGIIPLVVLTQNFAQVGMAGAILAKYGDIKVFFGLITPHGILELSCIVLAAALCLRLFWAIFVPGSLPRTEAFAKTGRELLPVALALILLLGISGIEEAFLTPSPLLPLVKVFVAVVVYALLVAWVVGFGHRAKVLGLTGDLAADQAGYHS